jgi:hypothetical protein
MYYLIIFSDYEQREIIFMGRFKKMKNIIEYTDNLVNYSTLENKTKNKYKTQKQLFKVIKK